MARSLTAWSVAGLAAAALVAGAGCQKGPPTAAPTPATNPPPTAFFAWCEANTFGVKAPQTTQTSAGVKNLPGAPIGDLELEAWTKAESEAEAREVLAGIERHLRRAAQEQGVSLDDGGPPAAGPGGAFTLRYRAGRNHGTLTGAAELRDNREGGRTVKRYFVRLTLTEVAADG